MALRVKATAFLAALLLVVLAACAADDESSTVTPDTGPATTGAQGPVTAPATGTVLAVTYRGGSVVDGAARQRAPLNQPVIVRVTSDVADEVHVHGYDKKAAVAAGSTTDLRFDANIPGVFEVELERAHKLLFTMEVR